MNPLVPVAIARLPWRLLFLLMAIAGFGLVVLYSAAGGSFTPWAAAQGLRFCVFFCMAIVISRLPIDLFKQLAFPAYAGILARSEEHTSELQSLMRISYAVFCLKKK